MTRLFLNHARDDKFALDLQLLRAFTSWWRSCHSQKVLRMMLADVADFRDLSFDEIDSVAGGTGVSAETVGGAIGGAIGAVVGAAGGVVGSAIGGGVGVIVGAYIAVNRREIARSYYQITTQSAY